MTLIFLARLVCKHQISSIFNNKGVSEVLALQFTECSGFQRSEHLYIRANVKCQKVQVRDRFGADGLSRLLGGEKSPTCQ